MTSNDIRDILEVKAAEPRPAKKQKLALRRPDHIPKELANLIGERLAPVVLQQADHYKKKFKVSRKAQPWEWQSFTNPCRNDGLLLRHWVKKTNSQPNVPGAPATPAESKLEEPRSQSGEASRYYWQQYDHKVAVPKYTDEQYEAQLKSDQWSKEETDYLFELVRDFDLRWIVIADRYDYKSKEAYTEDDPTAIVPASKARTMEDMKARYYGVASKITLIDHPLSSMSEQEFQMHERMTQFNPELERNRKRLAEALLSRSPEEIKEEEILLSELRRIVANEDKFLEERRDLYNRLDHPIAQGSITMYENSTGLQQLMQTLYYSDKNKKRRSIAGPGDNASSPAQGSGQTPTTARDHRASIGSATGMKKGAGANGPIPRQLSARDEARFGVSTHERLSSGVSFRSSRIDKMVLAKSQAQSVKLQDAIRHVGLQLRPIMPTTKICAEYERLIANVHVLLDARKVGDKLTNEIKVLEAQREARERRERGEEDISMVEDHTEEKDEDKDEANDTSQLDMDMDGDGDEDADGEGELDDEGGQATSEPENNDDEDDEDNEAEVENAVEDPEEDEDEDAESDEQSEPDIDAPEIEDDQDEDEAEDSEEEEEDAQGEDEEQENEDAEQSEEEEIEEARASVAPSTRSTRSAGLHKRSASVLSTPSEKSTKRQRR